MNFASVQRNMIIVSKSVIIACLHDIVVFAFTQDMNLLEYGISFVNIIYAFQAFGLLKRISLGSVRLP